MGVRQPRIFTVLFLVVLATYPGNVLGCFPSTTLKKSSPICSMMRAALPSLSASIVCSDNASFALDRLNWLSPSNTAIPGAIIFCSSSIDVQQVIAWAVPLRIPLALRSQRHDYQGFSLTNSSGVVLDVSNINYIQISNGNGTEFPAEVTIGAGARLIDVYSKVMAAGFFLSAGTCPTVGIAGHSLGGGIGYLVRKFGMACDSLLQIQIVDANANVLIANATTNGDLLWAACGAGPGSFGVVVELRFRLYATHTQPSMYTYATLYWQVTGTTPTYNKTSTAIGNSTSIAVSIVDAWQRWALSAPPELGSSLHIHRGGISVSAVFLGNTSILKPIWNLLATQPELPRPKSTMTPFASFLNLTVTQVCGCTNLTTCLALGQPSPTHLYNFKAKSLMPSNLMSANAIGSMWNSINLNITSPYMLLTSNQVIIDAVGGNSSAFSTVPANQTAFPHRNALFSVQFLAYMNGTCPSTACDQTLKVMQEFWNTTASFMFDNQETQCYRNYPDLDLNNQYAQLYWGSNLQRLSSVKEKYDPSDYFRFAQSVPLPAGSLGNCAIRAE